MYTVEPDGIKNIFNFVLTRGQNKSGIFVKI